VATSGDAKYTRFWLTNLTHPESVSEATNKTNSYYYYYYYYYYYCHDDEGDGDDGYVTVNL
jgi:hypothetical protein